MTKIGIFWVYKDTVIGKARDLCEGHENVQGLIDSPNDHVDLWEFDSTFIIPFYELRGTEYQDTPRGRVMYSSTHEESFVYMDEVLHNETEKQIVSDFFQLNPANTKWMRDIHYTTDFSAISDLFD